MQSRESGVRHTLQNVIRDARVPGLQFVAVTASSVLLEYSAGWADVVAGQPMSDATTQMAYSLSEPFTAAAVLQLVEAGRVALDDPVDRYVDANPYGSEVTIRQLLAHTGGLPSPSPLRWTHPLSAHAQFDDRAALRAVLARWRRRVAAPGREFHDSNLGYWLLGELVASVSGQSFVHYMSEQILQPLGVTAQTLGYEIVAPFNHARGYVEAYSVTALRTRLRMRRAIVGACRNGWLEIRPHYVNGAAYGGLIGSASGLGRLLQDQLRPTSAILGSLGRQAFFKSQRTAQGVRLPTGLGWQLGSLSAHHCYFKESAGAGFAGLMRLYPRLGMATVLICNATRFELRSLSDQIDRIVVARY